MFAVVGNSPSSGSSLLGDLLDSTPFGVCGPELNFWTNPALYADLADFRESFSQLHRSPSIYKSYNSLNKSRLFNYALDEETFEQMVCAAKGAMDLPVMFAERFRAFRGKPSAIWFEKTPENIQSAKLYLEAFPDNFFIHIVRNPLYVFPSLLKRGFPIGVAVFTWLFEVANLINIQSDRLLTIRYEDLVDEPWATTSKLVSDVSGKAVRPEDVSTGYAENVYRRLASKKIDTWGIASYGEIKNGNKKELTSEQLGVMKEAMNYRISDSWARRYNLPPVSYQSALSYFGYESTVMEQLEGVNTGARKMFGFRDFRYLLHKQLSEFRNSQGRSLNMSLPVQRVDE